LCPLAARRNSDTPAALKPRLVAARNDRGKAAAGVRTLLMKSGKRHFVI
jgi:hypothetical protein